MDIDRSDGMSQAPLVADAYSVPVYSWVDKAVFGSLGSTVCAFVYGPACGYWAVLGLKGAIHPIPAVLRPHPSKGNTVVVSGTSREFACCFTIHRSIEQVAGPN